MVAYGKWQRKSMPSGNSGWCVGIPCVRGKTTESGAKWCVSEYHKGGCLVLAGNASPSRADWCVNEQRQGAPIGGQYVGTVGGREVRGLLLTSA